MENNRPLPTVLMPSAVVAVPLNSVSMVMPFVVVTDQNMPSRVTSKYLEGLGEKRDSKKATDSYHKLKNDFDISHSEMANWLGTKRRTLYNWMNSPEKVKRYGPEIEKRLSNLIFLHQDMEFEHHRFLYKVAFSPIFGDPMFGDAINSGESSDTLIEWYDTLFAKFESLRLMDSSREAQV